MDVKQDQDWEHHQTEDGAKPVAQNSIGEAPKYGVQKHEKKIFNWKKIKKK